MKKRISISIIGVCIVLFIGTVGFYLIEGANLFDSFYMSVISISTVGYGEVIPLSRPGRIFAVFIIFSGMGVLTYFLTSVGSYFVEEFLSKDLRRRIMEKKIANLKQHIIVCGAGLTGKYITEELTKTERTFVLIDKNPEIINSLIEKNIYSVCGDATENETLLKAGIKNASGLISALPTDEANLFVVVSAKELNPSLRIVSKVLKRESEEKFLRSGADRIVNPRFIESMRLVSELVRPTVTTFLDKMLRTEQNIRVEELKAYKEILMKDFKVISKDSIVIGVKRNDEIFFNPDDNFEIKDNDILLLITTPSERENLKNILK